MDRSSGMVIAPQRHATDDIRWLSDAALSDEMRSTMQLVEERRSLLAAATARLTAVVDESRRRAGASAPSYTAPQEAQCHSTSPEYTE